MATYLNSTCFTKLKVVKVKSGETINIPIPYNGGLNIIKACSMTSIFFFNGDIHTNLVKSSDINNIKIWKLIAEDCTVLF